MSSQDFTTTGLIDTIRILASVPNNQQLSSDDATLLNLLNFELSNSIVPQLMAVREEYFVDNYDFETYFNNVTGYWQDSYEFPENAIGMKLRDFVQLVPGPGIQTPPLERFVPRISPEDVAGNRFNSSATISSGISFYVRNDSVVLYPCPTQIIPLRMKYFRGPNFLVSTSEAGQVVSINTAANSVVLTNLPSDWSIGQTVDVIQPYQGFNFDAQDVAITAISNPTLSLASVSGIKVGDWVALQGNSPIPQIPAAAQAVLAQAVVIKLLESLKDADGVKIAQAKYNELFKALEFMITPRIDGEAIKEGKKSGTVDAVADLFTNRDELRLMVTPEGTRAKMEKWKTGFYYIALKAKVPIALAFIDYKKRICGIDKIIYPTGDFKVDMKLIMDFYKNVSGKYPENFSTDIELA